MPCAYEPATDDDHLIKPMPGRARVLPIDRVRNENNDGVSVLPVTGPRKRDIHGEAGRRRAAIGYAKFKG